MIIAAQMPASLVKQGNFTLVFS